MDSNLVQKIKKRQHKLQKTKKELKAYFVGIDTIIDQIIGYVETWYIMPELLTRPTIICLFGPTGVGKTDLVRQLVKKLGIQEQYCELTVSNQGCPSYPHMDSIEGILSRSHIESGTPSVIMLDEIQDFRTIDEYGIEIHDCKFKDVWTLLSDGKLPYSAPMDHLMSMLWELQNREKMRMDGNCFQETEQFDTSEEASSGLTFGNVQQILSIDSPYSEMPGGVVRKSFYDLNYFKKTLKLKEPVEEIAKWSDKKCKQAILGVLNDKTIFEEEDYTKALIFISGNLDEAYGFAKDVKEVDVDADILYEMSQKINILDIKDALGRRFKPEQISRMGNNFAIYPSLKKSTFETIIDRKIFEIQNHIYTNFNINVDINDSIKTLIYNNGVYPTQGTRPLFSTISDVIDNSLPKLVAQAILKNISSFEIKYEKGAIVADIDGKIIQRKYDGTLDKLKKEHKVNWDRRALSTVHEAGHATAFALLFEMSPSQIVSIPAGNNSDGFVYTIESCNSKHIAKQKLCVMMAGQASEKICFGTDNVTSGSGGDLQKATKLAASMVRKWGMGSYSSVISKQDVETANNDQTGSNKMIDALVKECMDNVEELLRKNLSLLEDTIDALMAVEKLNPSDFKIICSKYNLEIGKPASSKDVIYWGYYDKYKDFKKNIK